MARITVEDCVDKFPSRFELVLVASQRARKLYSGEQPKLEKENDKNTVIALREIAEEAISVEEIKDDLVVEYQNVNLIEEEDNEIKEEQSEDDGDNKDVSLENSSSQLEEEISELNVAQEEELKESFDISQNPDSEDVTETSNQENDSLEEDIPNN